MVFAHVFTLQRRWRLALAPQRLAAFVDRVEIEQVVLNLLKNALDAVCAVPKRRRIVSISTRSRCKGLIECLVSDHGCGLPADGVVRVFEPYVTTKPDGLGLGLSIAKSLVELHRGLGDDERRVRCAAFDDDAVVGRSGSY